MSDTIITVENIGKKYVIDHQAAKLGYKSLRETVTSQSKVLAKKLFSAGRQNDPAGFSEQTKEDFWALKNVSFSIQQGEVLGVIGRNGAGKSTLLKVLSRITEPTVGRITLRGRIASLLEVGTGFHPELTGRENIFLNGAILGMSRVEIRRKFDEIVEFAGVEKFLDTPVKRYSSGMYVRLAFAVAAHLEPEILIVDEVLAVGDAEFQKKCLGKMQDVSTKEGRTVIFVSHNLNVVRSLCQTGLLLQRGEVTCQGHIRDVIEAYLSVGSGQSGIWLREKPIKPNNVIAFQEIRLGDVENVRGEFNFDEPITIFIAASASKALNEIQFVVRVTDQDGFAVFSTCNNDESGQYVPIESGAINYRVEIPAKFLSPGRYFLQIVAHTPRVQLYDAVDNEISFLVHDIGRYSDLVPDDRKGVVNITLPWHFTTAAPSGLRV